MTVSSTAPTTGELVAETADWRYYYDGTAPSSAWASRTFDDSQWTTGAAPIGYGSSSIQTTLPLSSTVADRPRTVYFRNAFTVDDKSKVSALQLTGVADDGVVIYVNGVEVARQNMPTGTITHTTFATAPLRTSVANASPVVVEVPTSLLVDGTNVISAETHVNYRGTPDLSIKLKAVATLVG